VTPSNWASNDGCHSGFHVHNIVNMAWSRERCQCSGLLRSAPFCSGSVNPLFGSLSSVSVRSRAVCIFESHLRESKVKWAVPVGMLRMAVLNEGTIVEDYPEDTPCPSRLTLGWAGHRPVHVVWATIPGSERVVIITVSEPSPDGRAAQKVDQTPLGK